MRDRSDRFQVQTVPLAPQKLKPLGTYLLEAGLLTPAQIDVALNDQKIVDNMRFGDVLVARGWIKQQTLDYLIEKIVAPEQQAAKQKPAQKTMQPPQVVSPSPQENLISVKPVPDSQVNDRKALPFSADDGVSWVG